MSSIIALDSHIPVSVLIYSSWLSYVSHWVDGPRTMLLTIFEITTFKSCLGY